MPFRISASTSSHRSTAIMNLLISRAAKRFEELRTLNLRIVMLGLDTAGKTTILYKLKRKEDITTIPTLGFNADTIKVKNVNFTVCDVGGQDKIRGLWHHYYANSETVIFVVDSTDHERMKEAAEELHSILNDPQMQSVPVMVFANKQDLPGAATPAQVIDRLGLRSLVHRNKWHVQASNAVTGEGLYEGLEAVARMSREFRKTGR